MILQARYLILLSGLWFSPLGVLYAKTLSLALTEKVLQHYADMAYTTYHDSLKQATQLREVITAFIAAPSAAGLEQAKTVWRQGRDVYGQSEVFRFYDGPIDGQNGPEGRINAWPLDEAYIDAVVDDPHAGIINDPRITLDRATLIDLNEREGETNIATGWHAIEFLLWGQDHRLDGPGERSYTDFLDTGPAPNAARRRQYLKLVADLLVADLSTVVQAWSADQSDHYRAAFIHDDPRESLRKILLGLAALSRAELAGERLEVALDTKDPEDEHSCFSDNTHRDIWANAQGIANIYFGRYLTADGHRIHGPGIEALLRTVDPALTDQLTDTIQSVLVLATQVPTPFDQVISADHGDPRRAHLWQLVDRLSQQADLLIAAGRALGIKRLQLFH